MKKLILFLAAVCYTAMMQAETIENVPYIDENGVEQSHDADRVISSKEKVILTDGWYYVTSIITISQGIICQGEVHLILTDNGTLTVQGNERFAGIQVPSEESSLTIYGQRSQNGKLVANGGLGAAGIGGGNDGSGSNITINGGVVTANGGDHAAGIGGGNYGSGSNITINGGTVTANGGVSAAGIGGGEYGNGSNITINGGTVTATSVYNAYGIGSGYQGETSSNIFVADGLKVVADEATIAHNSISDDIAEELVDKKNVTIFGVTSAIKAIDDAAGGSTDKDIVNIANTAKTRILVDASIATADGAKAISDLAVAKINALKEILPLIVDDTNTRNIDFISNKISDIVSAVSVNDVTTITTQAVIEIAAFLKGRSSAVGTMGTKQNGPALIVTDKDDKEIILYSPKSVEYIKVKEE